MDTGRHTHTHTHTHTEDYYHASGRPTVVLENCDSDRIADSACWAVKKVLDFNTYSSSLLDVAELHNEDRKKTLTQLSSLK